MAAALLALIVVVTAAPVQRLFPQALLLPLLRRLTLVPSQVSHQVHYHKVPVCTDMIMLNAIVKY
jgi:hypothetical protein